MANLSNFNASRDGDVPGPSATFSVAVFMLFLLSLITILGNSLILLAFASEKKLWTYQNHYIFNMAIADLLIGLTCMPLRATVFLFNGTWIFGEPLCIIFIGAQNVILGVSVLGVVVICVDRYLATFYPLRHYRRKRKRTAWIINILTWLIPFSLWAGLSIAWDFVRPNNQLALTGWCMPNYALSVETSVGVVILRAVCPFLFMLVLYLCIYFRLKMDRNKRLAALLAQTQGKWRSYPSTARARSVDAIDRELKRSDLGFGHHNIPKTRPIGGIGIPDQNTHCGNDLRHDSENDTFEETNRIRSLGHDCIISAITSVHTSCTRDQTKLDLSPSYSVPKHHDSHTSPSNKAAVGINPPSSTTASCPEVVFPIGTSKREGSERFDGRACLDTSANVPTTIALSRTPSMSNESLQSEVELSPRPAHHESESSNSKAMKTLTLLLLAFFITWFPNSAYLIIYSCLRDWLNSLPIMPVISQVQQVCRWISYANSLINPVAYAMAQPLFRHVIKRKFCKN
ncbi:muscarinic acetylcholine receptor M2-like [Diadema antillarum]|uniref:muscarinic acetylcholine receptor M2-like n=1 Tax=Diadema antillarum TaxID=105358 RepID=UPI003A852B1B